MIRRCCGLWRWRVGAAASMTAADERDLWMVGLAGGDRAGGGGAIEAGACASRARLTIRSAEVEAVEIDPCAFVGTGRGH
jgi:hypothetical protein